MLKFPVVTTRHIVELFVFPSRKQERDMGRGEKGAIDKDKEKERR